MQQLERADRRRIVQLHSLLRHGAAGGDVLGELLSELSTLLGFDRAGYYGFRAGDAELSLEFSHGLGDVWKDFEEALRAWPRWTFDPRRIERPERNRVVTVRAGDARPWRELPSVVELARRHPWVNGAEHQMRLLVCEGPALLAWIGGYRGGRKPFTEREQAFFQALARPLRERFRLERDLGRGRLAAAALPAVLEEISAPAFVVTRSGHVAHANSAGRARLDEAGEAAELRRALASLGDPRFRWAALPGKGLAPHFLAIEQRARPGHLARAEDHARRWGLTERQAEVLALLALGRANKAIAAELRCSESTVEFHVTALLAKAGVESRAELVARFWMEA